MPVVSGQKALRRGGRAANSPPLRRRSATPGWIFGICDFARYLGGLLGSADRDRYLDAAEHICATKQKEPFVLHWVLDGLELAALPNTRGWIEPLARYGKKTDSGHKAIREHAQRVLDALTAS